MQLFVLFENIRRLQGLLSDDDSSLKSICLLKVARKNIFEFQSSSYLNMCGVHLHRLLTCGDYSPENVEIKL